MGRRVFCIGVVKFSANDSGAGKNNNTDAVRGKPRPYAKESHFGWNDPQLRRLVSWFEDEFLDAPIQKFGDVEFVRGGAGDFVNPTELSELLAGFAEDPQYFSIEREFVNTAGKSVGDIENLIWSGGDANRPGSAGGHGARRSGWLVADGGPGVGRRWDIDGELAEEFSFGVEDLDAA